MTPDEYCQQTAANSGSSFYYSFLLLPRERRRAITAVYAFCREVDDIADECRDPAVARTKLAWWRGEIAAAFDGRPNHPVGRALLSAIHCYGLAPEPFQEIIDGMEMDLDRQRYPDFESLQLYCHRVAGVVGQISAAIFGYRDPGTLDYAHCLGLAFQLTNIIRDVGEDARRNRIYLPLDELAQFGVSPEDILRRRDSASFKHLMAFQIERAQGFYDRALAKLPPTDRKAQRPGLAMAAIYRELLERIAHDGCRVLERRASLGPLRKLWLAGAAWARG